MEATRYELVNPSDRITFEAETFEAATCATLLVGGGSYAAEPTSGGERVPIFLLGGFEEWFAARFPDTDFAALLSANRELTAKCLRSFVVGNREDFEAGAAFAPDRDRFRRDWNERKHTSLNNIAERADEIADNIERQPA